ncbi:MAG: nucleotidyl transferase AbiEii/AbiGii toxin family protein [Deltaproteobacteria bacterium]|nr:nucleotidyl transferase AbiEii/AbiGii toxin family protein [Deltaproteobacteria bacterium]
MTQQRGPNVAASVRQRLLDQARSKRVDFSLLLTRYGLERFLYRLGCSEYRERFILKGAMLFPLWGVVSYRSTRDVDLLGYGESEIAALVEVFRVICQTEVADDGVIFDPASVQAEDIRDQMEYGGTRIKLNADLAGARIHLQVDIGFGDVVTPAAIVADYPTVLDQPAPHVRVYPRETVVAEKFQAMVHLGIANSRMKDFHDLWVIGSQFNFDGATLTSALVRTFERRNTPLPNSLPMALTPEFFLDDQKIRQWKAFLNRAGLGIQPELSEVAAFIAGFVMPPIAQSILGKEFIGVWQAGGPWQTQQQTQ